MDSVKKETPAKLASPEDIELSLAVCEHLLSCAEFDTLCHFQCSGVAEALGEDISEKINARGARARKRLEDMIDARREATTGRKGPAIYPGPLGICSLIRCFNGEVHIESYIPTDGGLSDLAPKALELAEDAAARLADMFADENCPGWRDKGAVHLGAPETKEG